MSDATAQADLAGQMIATARDAVGAYEELVVARVTGDGPAPSGDIETDYRRWTGMAIGRLETAGCILAEARDAYDGPLLWATARESSRLALEIVTHLVSHAPAPSERLSAATATALALWADPSGAFEDQNARAIARERLAAEPA